MKSNLPEKIGIYKRKAEIYFHQNRIYGGDILGVVKIIELIGSSSIGWSEAAQNAVTEAAKTIKNIKGVHVKRCTAKVENDKIIEYNANVKISFIVERE